VTSPVEPAPSPLVVFDWTYAPTFQYQPEPDSGSVAYLAPS
jgi:hypothetical protein